MRILRQCGANSCNLCTWKHEVWEASLEPPWVKEGKPVSKNRDKQTKRMRSVPPCFPRDRTVRTRASCLENTLCSIDRWKVTGCRCLLIFLWLWQLGGGGQRNVKDFFLSLSPLSVGWQWPCFSVTAKCSHNFLASTTASSFHLPRNCTSPTVLLLLALACSAVLPESPPHPSHPQTVWPIVPITLSLDPPLELTIHFLCGGPWLCTH